MIVNVEEKNFEIRPRNQLHLELFSDRLEIGWLNRTVFVNGFRRELLDRISEEGDYEGRGCPRELANVTDVFVLVLVCFLLSVQKVVKAHVQLEQIVLIDAELDGRLAVLAVIVV